jgi:hypothetical protein
MLLDYNCRIEFEVNLIYYFSNKMPRMFALVLS